jgi:membrane complex biogenesis BtpA family protein
MSTSFLDRFSRGKVLIGMVHLAPLPGSPGYRGRMSDVIEAARADAGALADGGCDAVMVENFGDVPFFKSKVPPATVAGLTAAAVAVAAELGGLPMGINCLRNDGRSAMAIAVATGARFVRINVLSGARLTDQGIIEGEAADVLRDRRTLGGASISICADVAVKHSAALADRPLAEEVADVIRRGGAGAVIASGGGTGLPTDPAHVAEVRKATPAGTPVLVGSGATPRTAADLLAYADGLIVGTALQRDGRVAVEKVRELRSAMNAI